MQHIKKEGGEAETTQEEVRTENRKRPRRREPKKRRAKMSRRIHELAKESDSSVLPIEQYYTDKPKDNRCKICVDALMRKFPAYETLVESVAAQLTGPGQVVSLDMVKTKEKDLEGRTWHLASIDHYSKRPKGGPTHTKDYESTWHLVQLLYPGSRVKPELEDMEPDVEVETKKATKFQVLPNDEEANWGRVVRRRTYDVETDRLIADECMRKMSRDMATRYLPDTPKDIPTEFYYKEIEADGTRLCLVRSPGQPPFPAQFGMDGDPAWAGEFVKRLRERGARTRQSEAERSESNAIIERWIQELERGTAAQSLQANLPHPFWSRSARVFEFIYETTYVIQSGPAAGLTPHEATFKCEYQGELLVYGCGVSYLSKERDKFESRSLPGVFVCYATEGSIEVLDLTTLEVSRVFRTLITRDYQADCTYFPLKED